MPFKRPDTEKEIHPAANVLRVRRFVARVPELLETFLEEPGSERELLLRAELRRTISRLSGAFDEAASLESDSTQAAVLRAAAFMAHELAGTAEAAAAEH